MLSICDGWEFTDSWSDEFCSGGGNFETVRLPHTVRQVPLHYACPEDYEMICGYRRKLNIPAEYEGKRLFLQFDGAAHIADVFINGIPAGQHRCGYTAFRLEIGPLVEYGKENTVAVRLDCTENPAIPPFGYVIDYLTYGGLYREAWLDVRPQNMIEDVYLTTPALNKAHVITTVDGAGEARVSILEGERCLAQAAGNNVELMVPEALPWSPSSPKLFKCVVELGEDRAEYNFGFRTAEFREDGFYLNGEKTFLRGLNRHQCYPYIGYAAPERLQREDADILKYELGCNAVRTSHYPQSRYFTDECDRIGLLVFTEIPGWQHLGGEAWKEQLLEDTREMLMQYRSCTSIILWGVRVNESQDCDELYLRTNALAHELDPSRATSGVRYLEKSSLLEDVYSYNDFSHSGDNPGVRPKKAVTPDMKKPLIITEHNGHMFPTKSFDPWEKRQSQALRHARVLSDAMADGEHAGCFGWSLFDYPTHKDFGSGDRVCYHGVTDAFRNPKMAAALYASQQDEKPVVVPGSPMDIGDYPAGAIGNFYVFTNADRIDLYKNDAFVASFLPKDYPGLKHPPVRIDDLIGCLLETEENFSPSKAAALKRGFAMIVKSGPNNLSLREKLYIGSCMLKYRMNYDACFGLYGKYVANWGGEATKWRFDAVKNGETVQSAVCCPMAQLHFQLTPGSVQLHEENSYDCTLVRIEIKDSNGNTAPYAQLPMSLSLEGAAELVGPSVAVAEGGMTGTFVKTCGKKGKAVLTVSNPQMESAKIEFQID